MPEVPPERRPDHRIDPVFLARWSPRSFKDDRVSTEDLAALFEAARWAPSCYNEQPWLFVYAQGPEDRERVLGVLVDANRTWAETAPVLGVVFARKRFAKNDKDNPTSQFDAGLAAMSLALEATQRSLFVHFMAGFRRDAAHRELGVPEDDYDAIAAFAIGRRGDPAALPPQLAERETPSQRKPHPEIAFEGRFR